MKKPFGARAHMGIRKRLFLLLVVVFVSVLLLETFIFYNWYRDRKEAEMQANLELARATGKNFETFLQGLVHTELVAGQAIASSRPITDRDRDRLLDTFKARNPAVRSVSWMDPAGLVIASSLRSLVGIDLSDRSFYRQIKEGRDWAVSEVIVGRVTGRRTFTVNCAVRNKQGELSGVVTAAVEPHLLDGVLAVPRERNAGVSLIDDRGFHAYRYPRTEFTPEQMNWLTLYPVLGEALKGKEVVTTLVSKISREKRLVVFVPLSSIGWVAAASRAEKDVVAAITRSLLPQGILTLLVTLAAFGMSLGISRQVVSSVMKLRRQAKALGRGEIQRVEVDEIPGELRRLADTLNEMTEKIGLREDQLRESRAKLEAALASMTDAVFIYDAQGSLVDFNDAFATFHRFKNKEECSTALAQYPDILEVFLPDGTLAAVDMWAVPRALRGETATKAEYTLRRKDTGETWVGSYSFGPIRDKDGQIVGSVIIGRDITERKRTEEALQKAHDDLELRVQERTAELEQAYDQLKQEIRGREQVEQQLRRTQKLEALGTLAGGIAHDFNNVLAGIIGFVEMVLEDSDPGSPEHRRLELALKGAYRGRDLVKQILAFSRHGEQDKKLLVLARIVEESLNLLRPAFPSTIQIVWKNPADEYQILADPVQMHQVLMNLCTNAAHAMREKGGVLEIGISQVVVTQENLPPVPEMEPGEYILLEVSDTGCGMQPETLEQIFDPFFTTKREGEGTGLGLSVSYGIVKGHDGCIAVESEPGKGSIFRVYLPRLKEAVSTQDEEAPSPTGGKERILIVDDEDILVELNRQRLSDLGYDVVTNTSSIDALRIFREEPDNFDLVIADQTMPNLTGMDLTEELLKTRPDIPVILCSGHSDAVSPELVREAGIRSFLIKPFDKRELAEVVRRVLDTKVRE
ncbi:MAG: response regulator [Syntrophorhabdaceae bacterium]|nr:response regulator [Syntrophorhabdaceae bacterium]